MSANERGQLPPDLMRGRARFLAWRERRTGGGRIPEPLWDLAVELAKTHGVSRTATALGLDYYSLKKRAESVAAPSQSNGPVFVELAPPVMVGKHCQFELHNGAGATLRVQLVGYAPADLEALSRSLWSAL